VLDLIDPVLAGEAASQKKEGTRNERGDPSKRLERQRGGGLSDQKEGGETDFVRKREAETRGRRISKKVENKSPCLERTRAFGRYFSHTETQV